jgi:hypothetical protein
MFSGLNWFEWNLLLSGLYRRPRNFTGSAHAALVGYHHRSGIESELSHPALKDLSVGSITPTFMSVKKMPFVKKIIMLA